MLETHLDVWCRGTLMQQYLNGSAQAEKTICSLVAPVIIAVQAYFLFFKSKRLHRNSVWTETTSCPPNAPSPVQ